MSSSSSKVFFDGVILKRSGFSGKGLWSSVILVNLQANGLWPFRYCLSLQIFSYASPGGFETAVFKNAYGRLPLEFLTFLASGTWLQVLKVFCKFVTNLVIIHSSQICFKYLCMTAFKYSVGMLHLAVWIFHKIQFYKVYKFRGKCKV